MMLRENLCEDPISLSEGEDSTGSGPGFEGKMESILFAVGNAPQKHLLQGQKVVNLIQIGQSKD
jgi:hypothetical protein